MTRLETRAEVVAELITLVVSLLAAPTLMVMVAVHGWPLWWLIVVGMFAAWAGDALWALVCFLAEHTLAARRARRQPPATHHDNWTAQGRDATAARGTEHQHGPGREHERGDPPQTEGSR